MQGAGRAVSDEGASGEADRRSSRDDPEGAGHQVVAEERARSVWKRWLIVVWMFCMFFFKHENLFRSNWTF